MKKIIITVMALVLALSVLGCRHDTKETDYNKACSLFVEGKYNEAKTIFETLGDYNNCVQMIEKCNEKEIDRQFQGVWTNDDLLSMELKYENGSFSHTFGNEEVAYNGVYWIDYDAQLIYLSGWEDDWSTDFTTVIDDLDTGVYIANIVGYHKQYEYTFHNDQLEVYFLNSEDLLVKK